MLDEFNKCINRFDNMNRNYCHNRKLLYLAIPICLQYHINKIPNGRLLNSHVELSNHFKGTETLPHFGKYNDLLSHLNFFDLLLITGKKYDNSIKNWNDVENILKNMLNNESELFSLNVMNSLIDDTKNTFNKNFNLDVASIKNFSGIESDEKLIFYLSLLSIMIRYWGFDIETDDLSEFLSSSLNNFERKFGNYIYEEEYSHSLDNYTNNLDNYNVKSRELLKKLFDIDGISNNTNKNIFGNYTLLNFNYTIPNSFSFHGENEVVKLTPSARRNIHGTAICNDKSNLIIGIDLSSIKNSDSYDNAYKFTKTYRIMKDSENINIVNGIDLILKKNIKNITFYGHSLSKADYSYFQSIFDYFDVYNNNVSLSFCYSIYDQNKKESIKKEVYDGVFKLINDYGNGFTNKGKGENLLHKLLLEKRLSLSEV